MRTAITKSKFLNAASLGAAIALLCTATDVSATALSDLAAQMQPGEWRVLNTSGDGSGFSASLLESCGSDCGDNIFNYADKMTWDPNARKVHFIGQGHLRAQKYITYTESSHTWRLEPKPPWDCSPACIGHAYQHNTINPLTGDFYYHLFNSRSYFKLTRATGTWSTLVALPSSLSITCCEGLEYFPDRQGLVLASSGNAYFFNSNTNAWSQIASGLAMGGYHNVAVYNPVHKIVVFGGGDGSRDLYKLDVNGVRTKIANAPINVGISASVFTVDPASGKYLLLGSGTTVYQYDVASNAWSQVSTSRPFSGITYVVATPISTHGVVMFGKFDFGQSKIWLYKHATGGQPIPVDTTPPNAPQGLTVGAP